MGRGTRPGDWSACSRRIPAPGSCAMPTPDIPKRSTQPGATGSSCRAWRRRNDHGLAPSLPLTEDPGMRLAADLTLVGRRFEQGQVIDVDGGRIDGIQSLPLSEAHAADLVRLP